MFFFSGNIDPTGESIDDPGTMDAPIASTSTLPMTTAPLSVTKAFRPYYSPQELSQLIRLQATTRGDAAQKKEMSDSRIESYRQLACGYIERVGGRLGL